MMRYLLDTNVVSEWSKAFPDERVMVWLARQTPEHVAVSVMTIAETVYGIEIRPAGRKRDVIRQWYEEGLLGLVRDRIIPLDYRIIQHWSRHVAESERIGRTQAHADSLIMATAAVHGLTVVTRNVRDFPDSGVEVINPWVES